MLYNKQGKFWLVENWGFHAESLFVSLNSYLLYIQFDVFYLRVNNNSKLKNGCPVWVEVW